MRQDADIPYLHPHALMVKENYSLTFAVTLPEYKGWPAGLEDQATRPVDWILEVALVDGGDQASIGLFDVINGRSVNAYVKSTSCYVEMIIFWQGFNGAGQLHRIMKIFLSTASTEIVLMLDTPIMA